MQRNKERLVLFFDVKLEANSTSRPPYDEVIGLIPKDLSDLISFLNSLHSDPEISLNWPPNSKSDILYLADILPDKDGKIILLINRCDRNAADSVFYDPETKTRTIHEKKSGEGLDHSSHLVISAVPFAANSYRAVLEMAPGLSGRRVEQYLNFLFKECAMKFDKEFKVLHPSGAYDKNGKPVRVRIKHHCKMLGHMSPEFEQELNSGVLGDIELIQSKGAKDYWDTSGALIEKSRIIRIRETEKGAVNDKVGALKELCGIARGRSYEQLRVTFKTSDKLTRSAKLDTSTAALDVDSRYIKKVLIEGFKKRLPTSFDAIDPDLQEKLCELL